MDPALIRSHAPWLVLVLVLLAPCGGPCDRCTRAADPTTARALAAEGARPLRCEYVLNRAQENSDPSEMDPEDLLEEDDDSDTEGGCVLALLNSVDLQSPRVNSHSFVATQDAERFDSGRSAVLRC